MKKYAVGWLILACAPVAARRQEVYGRSFMFTRPAYYHLAIEQALWHTFINDECSSNMSGLQAIGIYQHSLPLNKTKRYFLINEKTELLVSGDANTQDRGIRDIRAEWLGLPENFRGYMSVNPKQRQIGAILSYHQQFKAWFDIPFLRDSWFIITAPVFNVRNDMNLTQWDIQNPGSQYPHDILQAFNQPSWQFGKINTQSRSKTALAEIKGIWGTTYVSRDYFEIAYMASLTVPIAPHQNPEYMFNPVVGNDEHVGLGGAVTMQFPLNCDTSTYAICYFINLEGIFLIRNHQFRTFDLRCRPYSRYMQFYSEKSNTLEKIPGVNVLTLEAIVRPYGMFDFSTGWRFMCACLEFEFGYNVWGHDDERVYLRNPFKPDFVVGIAGVDPVLLYDPALPDLPPRIIGGTASTSTIATRGPNDVDLCGNPIFVPLRESDIDVHSAESGSALNHMFHASLGTYASTAMFDSFVGGGAYIEIPQKNAALRNWGVWVKAGIEF